MRSLKRRLAAFLGAATIGMSCGGNVYAGFKSAVIKTGAFVAAVKAIDCLVYQVANSEYFGKDKWLFAVKMSKVATENLPLLDEVRNFWNLSDRRLFNSTKGSKGCEEKDNVSRIVLLERAFNTVWESIYSIGWDSFISVYGDLSVANAVRYEYVNLVEYYVDGNMKIKDKPAFIRSIEDELKGVPDKVFLTCNGKYNPLPAQSVQNGYQYLPQDYYNYYE